MLNCVTTSRIASRSCARGTSVHRFLQFFELRVLFAQKTLEEPALVRREHFRADQRNAAALVVAANSFAGACSANAATDDEIIALIFARNRTIISTLVRRQVNR